MLQSSDAERLGNTEDSMVGGMCKSPLLVETDFMDGLGKGVDENRREQVGR